MKRFYQTEWQNIKFADITSVSSKELPDAGFYNAFYRELFSRYSDYSELDKSWSTSKQDIAMWIKEQCPQGGCKILSVGCGLGYMESCLHEKFSDLEIHVSDFASDSLKWVQEKLPSQQIHFADHFDEHVEHGKYDIIYFSAVDYALPTEKMIKLLKQYKPLLKSSGICILISASFQDESGVINALIAQMKQFIRSFDKGRQFWGWLRTRNEYRELMKQSGYLRTEDGLIEANGKKEYYIKGTNQ